MDNTPQARLAALSLLSRYTRFDIVAFFTSVQMYTTFFKFTLCEETTERPQNFFTILDIFRSTIAGLYKIQNSNSNSKYLFRHDHVMGYNA